MVYIHTYRTSGDILYVALRQASSAMRLGGDPVATTDLPSCSVGQQLILRPFK